MIGWYTRHVIHEGLGAAVQVTSVVIVALLVLLLRLVFAALRERIGEDWTRYQLGRWFQEATFADRRLSEAQLRALATLQLGTPSARQSLASEQLLDRWMRDPQEARESLAALSLTLARRAAYRQGAVLSGDFSLRIRALRWRLSRLVSFLDVSIWALVWMVRAATVDRRLTPTNQIVGWVAGAGSIVFAAAAASPWLNTQLQIVGDVGTLVGTSAFAFALASPLVDPLLDGLRALGNAKPLTLLSCSVMVALVVAEIVLLRSGAMAEIMSAAVTSIEVPSDWTPVLGVVLIEVAMGIACRNALRWARLPHLRVSSRLDAAAVSLLCAGLFVITPQASLWPEPTVTRAILTAFVGAGIALLFAGVLARIGEVVSAAGRLRSQGTPVARRGHRWWALLSAIGALAVMSSITVPVGSATISWLVLELAQLCAFIVAAVTTILALLYARRVRRAEERDMSPGRYRSGAPGAS